MITKILTPWDNKFFEMVAECRSNLRITSPFIKTNTVNRLFESKNNNVEVDVVTSCKLMNFYRGAIDAEALSFILEKGGRVFNHQNLHAKIYIFDEQKAIVTSSNLTYGGLTKNYEYGIEITDPDFVGSIIVDFDNLKKDERTGTLEKSEIARISEIVNSLPKETKIRIPKAVSDEDVQNTDIFTGDMKIVASNLNGWQADVFACISNITENEFTLEDIYAYELQLSKIHPDNSFIKDKIRQQLQQLRDIGLIQFLGQGHYRKLWE